jgi:hypothetical protein
VREERRREGKVKGERGRVGREEMEREGELGERDGGRGER